MKNHEVSKNLIKLRLQNNLTQDDLAKKLNINGNKNKINVENDITNEKQIIPLDNNKIM